DPNDASGNTLYVGTGEPNGSSDSEAGVGLFKSPNGGSSWSVVSGSVPVSKNRSIGASVVDAPHASHLHLGTARPRRRLAAAAGDASFKQIITPSNPTDSTGERNSLAVASHTRVYVGQGGDKAAHLWRTSSADQPAATLTGTTGRGGWQDLSSSTKGTPGYGSYNFCTGQCWYDQPIASPAGHPDTLWIGGSMHYGELVPNSPSNGRAVMRSTDGGVTFTDMTDDAQSPPDWLHPDQHVLAFAPNNPDIAFICN